MASQQETEGLTPAIGGGLVGGVAGFLLGGLIFSQFSEGGLAALGAGLVSVLAGLIVGSAIGSWLALAVTDHERAVVTGLIVAPFMLVAAVASFVVGAALDQWAGLRTDLVALPVLFALGISAIWLARSLAMRKSGG